MRGRLMEGRSDNGIIYVDGDPDAGYYSDGIEHVDFDGEPSGDTSESESESESEDADPYDQYSKALGYLQAALDLWFRIRNNEAELQDKYIFDAHLKNARTLFKQLLQAGNTVNAQNQYHPVNQFDPKIKGLILSYLDQPQISQFLCADLEAQRIKIEFRESVLAALNMIIELKQLHAIRIKYNKAQNMLEEAESAWLSIQRTYLKFRMKRVTLFTANLTAQRIDWLNECLPLYAKQLNEIGRLLKELNGKTLPGTVLALDQMESHLERLQNQYMLRTKYENARDLYEEAEDLSPVSDLQDKLAHYRRAQTEFEDLGDFYLAKYFAKKAAEKQQVKFDEEAVREYHLSRFFQKFTGPLKKINHLSHPPQLRGPGP